MRSTIKWFGEALKKRPKGILPLTIRTYLTDLERFAAWYEETNGETMGIRDVTAVDVPDYIQYLQTKKKYKPATINRNLTALRAYFNWAIQERLIKGHPVRVRNV